MAALISLQGDRRAGTTGEYVGDAPNPVDQDARAAGGDEEKVQSMAVAMSFMPAYILRRRRLIGGTRFGETEIGQMLLESGICTQENLLQSRPQGTRTGVAA